MPHGLGLAGASERGMRVCALARAHSSTRSLPVTAIVIQYHVQIKRRRGRSEEGGGRARAAIKFLVRIYAHERRHSRNNLQNGQTKVSELCSWG